MAQAILLRGGVGGVTSSDVTASKQQVLKGYKTVTSDSDDEIVEGTFPVTSDADAKQEFWYYNDHGKDSYVTRIPEAAYRRYYNSDGSQGWDPWIRIPRALVKNGINYHPEATLESTNTCGEQGKIPIVDTSQNGYAKTRTSEYGLDKSRNIFYMHLPQRNAYYMRGDNLPHVEIDATGLGDALSSDIVSTKTATSKEGVAMRGTLPYKGNGGKPNGVVCPEMWYYNVEDSYVARFDSGAYYNSGNFKPYVSVPVSLVKQAVNYHPESTLNNMVTCNERGKVPVIDTKVNNYTVNQAKNFGIDGNRNKLYMELGYGNAYYCRDDNSPHVEVDAARLGTAGADSVLSGQTASSQYGIKFSGNIPRWICTTGDVISAVNGEGFAWDDIYAGRGRGIVMKILNGGFIQGANYAFLPSPNLKHWNIRKGVNINGEIGTMEDYGAGRVPFRNATFDNVLISGVASMGLGKNLQNYSKPSTSITDGIIAFPHNGIGLHKYYDYGVLEESITLAHSIDLTPFKLIRLGLKFPYGGRWGAQGGAADLVAIAMLLGTQYNPEYNPSRNAKIHPNVFAKIGFSRIIPQMGVGNSMAQIPAGAMYFVDIDVSNIQGQHRIVLGFGTNNPNGDVVTSQVIVLANNDSIGIGHIEFIN